MKYGVIQAKPHVFCGKTSDFRCTLGLVGVFLVNNFVLLLFFFALYKLHTDECNLDSENQMELLAQLQWATTSCGHVVVLVGLLDLIG